MKFTRDSSIWWFGILAALIGYLVSKQTPPTVWSYMDWLQFVSAVVGTVSGKLAWSPLDSKQEIRRNEIAEDLQRRRAALKEDPYDGRGY